MDRSRFLPWLGDGLLALVLAVAYPLEILVLDPGGPADMSGDPAPTFPVLATIAGVAFALSLAVRRRWPLLPLGLAIVAALAATPRPFDASVTFIAMLVISTYAAGRHARSAMDPPAALLVGLIAVVSLSQESDWMEEYGDIALVVVVIGGPYLAGLALRMRHDRELELRRSAALLAAEQEARAVVAVAAERTRIARELHDIVTHAIAVVVLQARGGRRALEADTDAARQAFDTIESTGSIALAEMRRSVALLRSTGDPVDLEPNPGLRDIDRLARRVSEAGLPVEIAVEGTAAELPPGVDLSAYRVVQEALTNTLRHAGPATARVVIRYGPTVVEVEIVDTGSGPGREPDGHGLVGMRERVALFGGSLATSMPTGGGFAIRATFPLVERIS